MGLLGILAGLGFLVWLSFRGWSVLILAPVAALIVALFSGEPLLAHWTQTFMLAAAGFVAQFFPLFLVGAIFGKLMDDSGSVAEITRFMTEKLGIERAILAVVLAGALVTYGGVSLFVAFFVIAPMAQGLFRTANIPNRLMPAAIALGTMTFTMSAMPGTPAVQNAIPMPFFGTTPFAAPGLGIIASAIMLGFGLWWLARAEAAARRAGEGFGDATVAEQAAADDSVVRERAATAQSFDPSEIKRGHVSEQSPGIVVAALPLGVVILVNLLMSMVVLPRMDTSFLAEAQWGGISLSSVSGVWSVVVALISAILVLVVLNRSRLTRLRETVDAGANASVLPILAVASLVGFGAVVAAMPAFADGQRVGAVDRRRAAGFTCRVDEHPGGADRFGLRRHDHRARSARPYLSAAGGRTGYRSGAAASRRGDCLRDARQPPAQRRRRHPAGRLRIDPQQELFRYRDGCHRQCDSGVGGGDRAGDDVRVVLSDKCCSSK